MSVLPTTIVYGLLVKVAFLRNSSGLLAKGHETGDDARRKYPTTQPRLGKASRTAQLQQSDRKL